MTARDEVLGRIRTALGGDPGGGAHPPGDPASAGYRTRGELEPAALLDLFAERLIDYRSQVRRTEPAGLLDAVRAALAERGANGVQQPGGFGAPHLAAVVNQPRGEQVEQVGRIELASGPVAR